MTNKDWKGLTRCDNIKERYRMGMVLGTGSFGSVRIGTHKGTGVKCAIKVITKKKLSEKEKY